MGLSSRGEGSLCADDRLDQDDTMCGAWIILHMTPRIVKTPNSVEV